MTYQPISAGSLMVTNVPFRGGRVLVLGKAVSVGWQAIYSNSLLCASFRGEPKSTQKNKVYLKNWMKRILTMTLESHTFLFYACL